MSKNNAPDPVVPLSPEDLTAKVISLTESIANQDKIIAEQNAKLETQQDKIADLEQLIQEGKTGAAAADGKDVTPTIPTDLVDYNGKKYKWNVAAFYLPGDSTKYTADEASVTEILIERILKIEGQKILQEQA